MRLWIALAILSVVAASVSRAEPKPDRYLLLAFAERAVYFIGDYNTLDQCRRHIASQSDRARTAYACQPVGTVKKTLTQIFGAKVAEKVM